MAEPARKPGAPAAPPKVKLRVRDMRGAGAAFVRIFEKELRQAGLIEPEPATANDPTWTR